MLSRRAARGAQWFLFRDVGDFHAGHQIFDVPLVLVDDDVLLVLVDDDVPLVLDVPVVVVDVPVVPADTVTASHW